MKQLSLEDINLDMIPINVLQDVDKRISDWRSMGGQRFRPIYTATVKIFKTS